MELNMKVKQVYGKDLVYPGCAKSELLSELLKKKTFDPKELQILVKLGYKIVLNGHVPNELQYIVNIPEVQQ